MSNLRLNITFHGVGPAPHALAPEEQAVWVDTDQMVAILDRVRGRGDVAISADDGNASDAELLLPALTERGMVASFFVVADRIDQPDYLSGAQLRRMHEAGMTIGSHGFAHRSWRGLDATEAAREMGEARRCIEDALGQAVRTGACPFGAYDRKALARLREAGFERVYTSDGGWCAGGAWLQPRNSVGEGRGDVWIDQLLQSPTVSAKQRLKRWVKRWR